VDRGQSLSQRDQPAHRHPAIIALVVIVFAQTLELLAATVASGLAIIPAPEQTRGVTIALAVTALLLCLGVGLLGWGLLVGRRHLLGAVLTWQFMEIAVAIGAFEGIIGGPDFWWVGLALLLPALAGVVLCVIRPVTSVFGRQPAAASPAATGGSGDPRAKRGPTPKRR